MEKSDLLKKALHVVTWIGGENRAFTAKASFSNCLPIFSSRPTATLPTNYLFSKTIFLRSKLIFNVNRSALYPYNYFKRIKVHVACRLTTWFRCTELVLNCQQSKSVTKRKNMQLCCSLSSFQKIIKVFSKLSLRGSGINFLSRCRCISRRRIFFFFLLIGLI